MVWRFRLQMFLFSLGPPFEVRGCFLIGFHICQRHLIGGIFFDISSEKIDGSTQTYVSIARFERPLIDVEFQWLASIQSLKRLERNLVDLFRLLVRWDLVKAICTPCDFHCMAIRSMRCSPITLDRLASFKTEGAGTANNKMKDSSNLEFQKEKEKTRSPSIT